MSRRKVVHMNADQVTLIRNQIKRLNLITTQLHHGQRSHNRMIEENLNYTLHL